VPDTSVVCKWYLHEQEPGREQALALRRAHLERRVILIAPDLLPYEVVNVLRYKPGWDAVAIAQAVDSLFAFGMDIVPVSPALLKLAVTLACDHDVAVYDACFVALARECAGDFLTADERLLRQLAALPYVHHFAAYDQDDIFPQTAL
jgi:predicted nucleic acid-binding protein